MSTTTIYKEDFTGDNWLCIIRDLELPVDTDEIILKYICHVTSTKRKGLAKANPFFQNGAPGRIRTSDRSVRSRVLYPAELRAL